MTRAGPRRDRAAGAALLLLFAVLVSARMPAIVLKGRFWAEEGHDFFHNALVLPPLQALVLPVGGYLNIVANGATLAARWLMPLGLAPYLTIAVALVFQLAPPWLVLTARDPWLRPAAAKPLACALLLLVPASEEIWLQTLHSQFELVLCCAIITSLELPPAGWLGRARGALLFLAPLCGPGAIAVLPLLAGRAALDRSRARLHQLFALAAGSAIQLGFFLHPAPGRSYALDPATLLCIVTVRHLALPFGGVAYADRLSAALRLRLAAGHVPLLAVALPILVFVPFGLATLWWRRARPAAWLLAAGVLVAGASYFGAIGNAADLINPRAGERYAFAPQALFGLAALALGLTATGLVARLALLAALWLVVAGAIAFFQPWSMISDGPSWRREVAIWRTDHAHLLQSWPGGWTVRLEGTPAR